MPPLVISKFEEDPIKHEGTVPGTTFAPLYVYRNFFRHSRVSNSKLNIPILPKFELHRDFMHTLIICKSDEEPLKNEDAIDQTTFSPL